MNDEAFDKLAREALAVEERELWGVVKPDLEAKKGDSYLLPVAVGFCILFWLYGMRPLPRPLEAKTIPSYPAPLPKGLAMTVDGRFVDISGFNQR